MTQITSQVRLISEVLYGGCFEVPWHQRYYDWSTEEVSELLADLKDALDSRKPCYFIGSVMLVEASGDSPRKINDGQQRFITLSLLIASLCRRFVSRRINDRVRETWALRALFVRSENEPSSHDEAETYQPRIEPPKNDKSKYLSLICGKGIGTNGLLTQAWRIIEVFTQAMSKALLGQFFDFLMQRVEVSVLDIPQSVDANSVFESLNARGKPLDSVDLIRNRLYSYFSGEEERQRRERVHESLERAIVVSRTSTVVQEYFRCFFQCKYGYLQKKKFHREARVRIDEATTRRNANAYVYDLVMALGQYETVELFRTITSSKPTASLDAQLPTVRGKRSLTALLRELQAYRVSYPLAFALLHRFMNERRAEMKRSVQARVVRSLRNLTSFMLRTAFVVPKFESSPVDASIANCANRVFKGKDLDSLDILSDLERIDEGDVMRDSTFVSRIADVEFPSGSTKKARIFLFALNAEMQIGADAIEPHRCALEHILPQSPEHWPTWTGFRDVDRSEYVYKSGNLVVMPRAENRAGARYNASYRAKREAFRQSALEMPRGVANDYEDWTPEAVERRSGELARMALATWRFWKES